MIRHIPKIVVDPEAHQKEIKDQLDLFFTHMKWKSENITFTLLLWLENFKDGKRAGCELTQFDVNGYQQMVKALISMYVARGRAIWIEKLKMRHINDSYDEQMRKRKIYGNHIGNYSKGEKMFLCQPLKCVILFKEIDTKDYYSFDDVVNNLINIDLSE